MLAEGFAVYTRLDTPNRQAGNKQRRDSPMPNVGSVSYTSLIQRE